MVDDEEVSEEDEEEHAVTSIMGLRDRDSTIQYIEKHPDQSTPYAAFVSKDMPSIKLLGDNHKDDCAFHALQMAFELMGGFEKTSVRINLKGREQALMASLSSRGGTKTHLKMECILYGVTQGIMTQTWMRTICFVRRVMVELA
ncbi:unnamed protein product [Hyaloperonospora brassicae]|uniref:Uncharacterized protein n=1 Tax=Hyaloperonospora brassicae TaxID=162125 RepID=A0AAV0TVH3_HYABA|nr:unnamed protein product [Hyaloperonospora brassicae]